MKALDETNEDLVLTHEDLETGTRKLVEKLPEWSPGPALMNRNRVELPNVKG